MFCSLDTKFSNMIVRDIAPEIFEKIKDDSEYLASFSCIKKSKINPKFSVKQYFRAEFTEWSPYERSPYCLITESLGSLIDQINVPKVIAISNGIS